MLTNFIALEAGNNREEQPVIDTTLAGLNENELKHIPVHKVGECKKESSFDLSVCTFCFMDFEDETFVKQTACGHYFHPECIDAWLRIKNQCPICKARGYVPEQA